MLKGSVDFLLFGALVATVHGTDLWCPDIKKTVDNFELSFADMKDLIGKLNCSPNGL